jgi:hypothetical protein
LGSPDFDPDKIPDLGFQRGIYDYYGRPMPQAGSTTKITREEVAAKKEDAEVKEVEKNGEEEGGGVVASVAKKVGKGAAKGAVRGAVKELWK